MNIPAIPFYEAPWFNALLSLALAIVLARVVDMLFKRRDAAYARFLNREPDNSERTRRTMIRRLSVATALFVGIAIALLQFKTVSALAQTMLASAAIIAAILGIAARAPIANLVSGIMIAFSQPVRLNDCISVDGVVGTIEKISLTYTFIRTPDETHMVIPNEVFASKAVQNFSLGPPQTAITIDVELPATADAAAASDALLALVNAVAAPPEGHSNTVEITELKASGTTLRLRAWSPEPEKRSAIADELRRHVQHWLRENATGEPGGGRAG